MIDILQVKPSHIQTLFTMHDDFKHMIYDKDSYKSHLVASYIDSYGEIFSHYPLLKELSNKLKIIATFVTSHKNPNEEYFDYLFNFYISIFQFIFLLQSNKGGHFIERFVLCEDEIDDFKIFVSLYAK